MDLFVDAPKNAIHGVRQGVSVAIYRAIDNLSWSFSGIN
jgi:hypothetical protein